VDITGPQSTPLELQAIVPNFKVPIVPIMKAGTKPFGVFEALLDYPWVLPPIEYENPWQLVANHLVTLLAAWPPGNAGRGA
jgi:hypothetical protein